MKVLIARLYRDIPVCVENFVDKFKVPEFRTKLKYEGVQYEVIYDTIYPTSEDSMEAYFLPIDIIISKRIKNSKKVNPKELNSTWTRKKGKRTY